jgi:hypothetical protein
VEPVRYIGVACIIAGALLICAAMCCWLQAPGVRAPAHNNQVMIDFEVSAALPSISHIEVVSEVSSAFRHGLIDWSFQMEDPIHVITVPSDDEVMQQKPPDYDSVAGAPPTYDDAIKLNPAHFLPSVHLPRSCDSTRTSMPVTTRSILCSSSNPNNREDIPGQLESVVIEGSAQTPKTPPPPYRSVTTVR